MFAKYLKNKHISYFQARFCRYALPILPADLKLLHEINGFGRWAGFQFCCVQKGPGKRERCRNGAFGESSTFRLFVSMI